MREKTPILEKVMTAYFQFVICLLIVIFIVSVTVGNAFDTEMWRITVAATLLLVFVRVVWYIYSLGEVSSET